MPDLTPKQERFVQEYLVDLNATQAAIRAGYSARTAHVQGSRLLTNARIASEISIGRASNTEKLGVTQEMVVSELKKLGFSNMLDYMRVGPDGDPRLDFSSLTRDQAAALTEVTVDEYTDGRGDDAREVKRVKFKLSDKRAALYDLGKHLGMFIDRSEVEVRVTLEDLIRASIKDVTPAPVTIEGQKNGS